MRAFTRPLLEVGLLYGLLGWLYVAAGAATRPDEMSLPVALLFPVRRDTFGACCFVVSAAAAFVLQIRGGLGRPRRPVRSGPVDAGLRTVAGYTLLVWAYLCVNSLTHPETLGRQFTHFAPVPSEGTTAVTCFVASAAALLALRVRGAVGMRAVAASASG